jgi:hypothetical protein
LEADEPMSPTDLIGLDERHNGATRKLLHGMVKAGE